MLLCKDMNYTNFIACARQTISHSTAVEMIPSIFFDSRQTQTLTSKLALFMAFRYKETQSAGKIVVRELSEILPIKHSQLFTSKLEIYLT